MVNGESVKFSDCFEYEIEAVIYKNSHPKMAMNYSNPITYFSILSSINFFELK